MSVDIKGKVFINDTEIAIERVDPEAEGDHGRARRARGAHLSARDKKADYGTVAKVMGRLSGAGFKRWRS